MTTTVSDSRGSLPHAGSPVGATPMATRRPLGRPHPSWASTAVYSGAWTLTLAAVAPTLTWADIWATAAFASPLNNLCDPEGDHGARIVLDQRTEATDLAA